MLYKLRSFVVLIVLGALAFWGCGDDNGSGPGKVEVQDSISIKSVTPNSGLVEGIQTDFVVAVAYHLASADSGELNVGFNNVQIDQFNIVSDAKAFVAKGSGEHQFSVSVFPKNWGDAGDFKAYVNLSEHPHGPSWTPLATDTRVLTFE
ncbi:MAG: hypothetical protein JSW58_10025 [Candidatus Latescibacterota bacterium]|nr:MAG: hypothetical protein JSW58_10025 [Candidatus Latescibacterota bacterium]